MLMLAGAGDTEIAVTVGAGVVVGDPQPSTAIKATGRAREMNLTQHRNRFMLALGRYLNYFRIDGLNPLKIDGHSCSPIWHGGEHASMNHFGARAQMGVVSQQCFSGHATVDISQEIWIQIEPRRSAKRRSSRAHSSVTDVTSKLSNVSVM